MLEKIDVLDTAIQKGDPDRAETGTVGTLRRKCRHQVVKHLHRDCYCGQGRQIPFQAGLYLEKTDDNQQDQEDKEDQEKPTFTNIHTITPN